jgi:hypothetical protein
MSGEYSDVTVHTFPAVGSLVGFEKRAGKFTLVGGELRVDLADSPTVGGQLAVAGLIWSVAQSLVSGGKAGQHVGLAVKGVGAIVAGGALSAGDVVTTDTLGRAVAAVSGDYAIGMVLNDCSAAGEIVSILLDLPAKRLP